MGYNARSHWITGRTGRAGKFEQPLVNHIDLVLDGSSSMSGHQAAVVKLVDSLVKYLARRSQELGQETRISVHTFADEVECLVWDTDVLRTPSIANLYAPHGNTALIDATITSQRDLSETAQRYGSHSFLTYVITDGQENASRDENGRRMDVGHLKSLFGQQADNWTIALLVPNVIGKRDAIAYGFPKDNVSVWDADSLQGVEEASKVITDATEGYLRGRAAGVVGSRTLFSTGADTVNKTTVTAALTPLPGDKYRLIPVAPDGVQKGDKVRVDKFIRDDCGMAFQLGHVYYEWSKKETVQPQKRLAVVQKSTDKVFVGTGDEIRQMIGLPNLSTRTAPQANPDYTVFVQSTAPNRNLVPFSKVLVML